MLTYYQNRCDFLKNWYLIILVVLLTSGTAFGMDKTVSGSAHQHDTHPADKGHRMKKEPAKGQAEKTGTHVHQHQETGDMGHTESQVGVDEQLGRILPMGLTVRDENNQTLVLREFINKPTLILPIFYHCPATCSLMLANLAGALNRVTAVPGEEYRVIAFSFNDEETPAIAKKSKRNYLKILKKDFPEAEWKFVTTSHANIKSFTDKIGFKFLKTGKHQFVHPNVLIAVSPEGKIIRYLYGPDFLPFDIGMALAEAEKGTPGLSIKRVLSYCFAYDSEGRKYVFRTFRILGSLVLIILGAFFFWVTRKKGKGPVR